MTKEKGVLLSVRRKLLIIVAVSILITTIPGLTILYYNAQSDIIKGETASLIEETERIVKLASQRFAASDIKLRSLARQIERALAQPDRENELAEFDKYFIVFEDGILRNRPENYVGTEEAGLFLPSIPAPTARQKIDHLRIKQVFDVFGAATTRSFENCYYLSPARGEVVFDIANPNYAYEMPADIDYTQTPWFELCTPANNPKKILQLTPPLYEPVMGTWMVSAVLPVYAGERWLGSIGEDMALTNDLAFMFQSTARYSLEQHFLTDREGNLILAGHWQKLLEDEPDAALVAIAQVPHLQQLLQNELPDHASLLDDRFILDGQRYVAVGMTLGNVGWNYVRLVPTNQILAPMQRFFFALILVIIAMSIVTGLIIAAATNRTISHPIMQLADAMRRFGGGSLQIPPHLLKGRDEISFAAKTFAEMADQLEQAIAEIRKDEAMLKELNVHLADKVAEKTQDLELSLAKLQEAQSQLVQTEKMAALMHIIAGVCHEINTPLGNALMACSLCEEGLGKMENAEEIRALSNADLTDKMAIERESWRATESCLLQVVQLLRRFEQVHMDDEAFIRVDYNLGGVFAALTAAYNPQLEATGHSLHLNCQVTATAYGSPGAVEKTAEAIIDNAIKHGMKGQPSGQIAIDVKMTDATTCQVSIASTGKPIPPEVLPRIFDPFYTTSDDPAHTGLGLSIAYNYVTRTLGGHIECFCSDDEKTIFLYSFPLRRE
jgi:signal transduction histidine kinase